MFPFFGSQKPTHALGIDIGHSTIKVVQLRLEKEKIFLETYGEVALGPYASFEVGQAVALGDEKVVEALEDLFKASKITTREAALAVDSSSTFVSLIEVPNVSDKDLRSMIPLEARKYIPIPVAEVQLDFWRLPHKDGEIVPEDTKKKTQVVLAAVKNNTLEKYVRYATKLGLENPLFEIESFSFLRSAPLVNQKFHLFLDIGSQYTSAILVENGVILDLHIIPYGSQNSTLQIAQALAIPIAVAEESKRTFGYPGDRSNPYLKEVMQLSSYPLFGEVTRLLLVHERKYNQVVEGIIIGGGGARTPGILEAMKETIRTPVQIINPFDQVEVPAFLKDMIIHVGPSYAVALGLALKKLRS